MSNRQPLTQCHALLLSRRRTGDGHYVVRTLLDDNRVVAAFAPAARRSQRRFDPRIGSYATFAATLRFRPPDRHTLEGADSAVAPRQAIGGSAISMATAAVAIETMDKLVPDGQHVQPYFEILNRGLDRIAADAGRGHSATGTWLEIVLDILEAGGYSEGSRCRKCGERQAIACIDPDLRRAWCGPCSTTSDIIRSAIPVGKIDKTCRAVEHFFDQQMHAQSRSVPLIRLAQRDMSH